MTKGIILFLNLSILFCLTSGTLTGKWKLIQYKDLTTGQTEYEPIQYKGQVFLTFNFQDDGRTGKFYGQTVNNDAYGEYTLMPNNEIKVENFSISKVAEPEWGIRFWNSMHQSTSYKINKDTLTIFYDDDKKCMVFINKAKR